MLKKTLFFLLGVTTVYGCTNSIAETRHPVSYSDVRKEANSAMPAFKMLDQNGKQVNLADLKGKKVFVNIWASWCGPCRAEMPSIDKLYGKIDKTKTAFVLLSLDQAPENGIRFAQKSKLSAPVYFPGEGLPAIFNVQSIPTTFIFNEKGKMIKRIVGGENYDSGEYVQLFTK